MKHSSWVAVLILAGCAAAQTSAPSSPRDVALSADSSVDDVLDALDIRGKQLTDLVASVKLSDTDAALGSSSTRIGKMWLQRTSPTDARIRVSFVQKVSGTKTINEKLDYVLEGGWLTEQDYRTKKKTRRQVLRPGEKLDLFKLGEGPFPLPLGQDKADVHKVLDVKKIPAAKSDPANTAHLELTPKAGTKLAKKFNTIGIWVDVNQRMPVRIETIDPNQTTIQTTELSDIHTNVTLGDKDFALEKVDPNQWEVREEPYTE